MPAGTELTLRGVGRRLDGGWIWRDVSFRLSPGDRLGLVGPSGSGKTLLLRAIAGLAAYALASGAEEVVADWFEGTGRDREPGDSVRYQILIMFMIASCTALATVGVVLLAYRTLYDDRHRLRLEKVTRA